MPDSPNPIPFMKRLEARAAAVESLLCVGLDPHPALLAAPTAQAARDFCLRLIDRTCDQAAAFKPNSAFFEAFGAVGFEALREVIAHIRQTDPTIPVVLDAKRGDIASTAEAYARAAFDYFDADAITLNPYLGSESIAPFLAYPDRGVFVLCRTTGAAGQKRRVELQNQYTAEMRPVYEAVALEYRAADPARLGLVVGATDPDALANVRDILPAAWFLVPGVGAQGGDLASALRAGLREANAGGGGLLINVSRSLAEAADPREAAKRLRTEIQAIRASQSLRAQPSGASAAQGSRTIRNLVSALMGSGCVRFGKFTLKSGIESPIYLDLRRLVSFPRALRTVGASLVNYVALEGLPFAHLAAIPYAALPIATAAALIGGWSLVYPRREAKTYGTRAQVEGAFEVGDTVLLVDDLATTGDSKFEAIEKLQSAGLVARDVLVVIDREQGARQALESAGYRFHALITLTELLDELQRMGHIDDAQRRAVDAFLAAQRAE